MGKSWNQEAGAFLDEGGFGNPTMNNMLAQMCKGQAKGYIVPDPIVAIDGTVAADVLPELSEIAVVAAAGKSDWTRDLRVELSERAGPIIPLVTETVAPERYVLERHLCIDTTAAGGNASLLAASS